MDSLTESRIATGMSVTEAERTHWLVTFTELTYVASMIALGHFLESEKTTWSGWRTAVVIFYSFWSTWTQMACYQAHIVDTGVLEKVWAFLHCFSMLMMGGFVNAFHQEHVMNPDYPSDEQNHRLLAAACDGAGHAASYQVQHPIFVAGLILSRWTLASMYGVTALSSGPELCRLMGTAASIFGLSSLGLIGSVLAGTSADSSGIVMSVVITFEFIGLYIVTRYPAVCRIEQEDVREVQNECDVDHIEHALGQFLFIVIGEQMISMVNNLSTFATWDIQQQPHSIWSFIFFILLVAFLLAIGYFDAIPHHGDDEDVNKDEPHHGDDDLPGETFSLSGLATIRSLDEMEATIEEEDEDEDEDGDGDDQEDVAEFHVGEGNAHRNSVGLGAVGSGKTAEQAEQEQAEQQELAEKSRRHALGNTDATSFVWIVSHFLLGFALLHISAGVNEMLYSVKKYIDHNSIQTITLSIKGARSYCSGLSSALFCIVMIRMSHKGLAHHGKRGARLCSYLIRFGFALVPMLMYTERDMITLDDRTDNTRLVDLMVLSLVSLVGLVLVDLFVHYRDDLEKLKENIADAVGAGDLQLPDMSPRSVAGGVAAAAASAGSAAGRLGESTRRLGQRVSTMLQPISSPIVMSRKDVDAGGAAAPTDVASEIESAFKNSPLKRGGADAEMHSTHWDGGRNVLNTQQNPSYNPKRTDATVDEQVRSPVRAEQQSGAEKGALTAHHHNFAVSI
jgi:hypothetical protein